MISDQLIWKSGEYKLLFGTKADEELQAKIKVVKLPDSRLSDGEIRSRVIQAMDEYFELNNWGFGQAFFATEMYSYIHNQLSTHIASVVIVPKNGDSNFGHLHEIKSEPQQIFLHCATVNDVDVIGNLTRTTIRIGD